MTLIKNYNYNEKEISMIVTDTASGEFLWVGFKQDASGNCALQKVSAHDPNQVYFDIDLSIIEIVSGVISGSYIYLAIDDDAYIASRYTLSNPTATPTNFDIPAGITEAPVDILIDTNVYILIPGNASGTNTKILEFTTTGIYQSTIDLTTINNASSFTKDGTDFWVVTNSSPAQYVRVYPITGGYDYTAYS